MKKTIALLLIVCSIMVMAMSCEKKKPTNQGIPSGGEPLAAPKCAQCAALSFDACQADAECNALTDLDGDPCCVNSGGNST